MAKNDMPDPLKPAHITGQNPQTPERMPAHTRYAFDRDADSASGNEEDLGGRPAFLYRSEEWAGVTLDSSGQNLPARNAPWTLERYFTLGVRDVGPQGVVPEQIIRGIHSAGYYVWRVNDPSRTAGTSS